MYVNSLGKKPRQNIAAVNDDENFFLKKLDFYCIFLRKYLS
jgi:hypothetical protein